MLGETVYYVAADFTFASGNRLAHGAAGEVMGPTAVNHVIGKGLSVLFPGNKATVAVRARRYQSRGTATGAGA